MAAVAEITDLRQSWSGDGIFLQSFVLRLFSTVWKIEELKPQIAAGVSRVRASRNFLPSNLISAPYPSRKALQTASGSPSTRTGDDGFLTEMPPVGLSDFESSRR